jgi:transcriptional regulator with XRE-family HTH domain
MATRDTAYDRGIRKARKAEQIFAEAIREARLDAGMSQAAAARIARMSVWEWGRVERGQRRVGSFERAAVMASAVGLDLSINLYASDVLPRDAGQLRLLHDLRSELGPAWRWRHEVRVTSDPADQRAWDAEGTHETTGLRIVIDAEARLRDIQRLMRRIEGKRSDSRPTRVVLAVRESKWNREMIREAGEVLRSAFPTDTRTAMRALRSGLDPGGDALVIVPFGHGQPPDARPERPGPIARSPMSRPTHVPTAGGPPPGPDEPPDARPDRRGPAARSR